MFQLSLQIYRKSSTAAASSGGMHGNMRRALDVDWIGSGLDWKWIGLEWIGVEWSGVG